MSATLKDRLEALRKARRSVKPSTLHGLLTEAQFTRRFGKGDHWVYSHPQLSYRLTIDPNNPLLPAYVSKAITAIEEVLASEES